MVEFCFDSFWNDSLVVGWHVRTAARPLVLECIVFDVIALIRHVWHFRLINRMIIKCVYDLPTSFWFKLKKRKPFNTVNMHALTVHSTPIRFADGIFVHIYEE